MSYETVEVSKGGRFRLLTSIWLVPFVALIIALWLAWQHYSRLGPMITIYFPENQGLEAGQSVVKFKDVPVGKVTDIRLSDDGHGVIVHVRMNKDAEPYLNEHTRFWIVKPEVSLTGVSGLETLVSGTYIKMYATKDGKPKRKFYGLNNAFRNVGEGEYFSLTAPEAYNVVKGTPVYFKNIKVGQVEYLTVSLDGKGVDFVIFVDKSYASYIHTDSKFWVMSALDIDISGGRLDVNLAPIGHLIHSGIAFSSSGDNIAAKVPDDFVFYLYKNKALANQKKIGLGGKSIKTYRMIVEDSVAKLTPNAPVRYNGFDVGRVKEIHVDYNRTSHKMVSQILMSIDTSSFADPTHSGEENIREAVKEGLRAQVRPTDPITGLLYIDLHFVDETNLTLPPRYCTGNVPLFPSVPAQQSAFMSDIKSFVAKLNALPLDKIAADLRTLLHESNTTVSAVRRPLMKSLTSLTATMRRIEAMTSRKSFVKLPDRLDATLVALQRTLRDTEKTLKTMRKGVQAYDAKGIMAQKISQTLRSVTETSEQMKRFLKMLNRKPNSLIFGDK